MAAALTGAKGFVFPVGHWVRWGKMWDVWFISSRMLVGQQELSGLVIVPNMYQTVIFHFLKNLDLHIVAEKSDLNKCTINFMALFQGVQSQDLLVFSSTCMCARIA